MFATTKHIGIAVSDAGAYSTAPSDKVFSFLLLAVRDSVDKGLITRRMKRRGVQFMALDGSAAGSITLPLGGVFDSPFTGIL